MTETACGAQIRAAAALRGSAADLAETADVAKKTISRFAEVDGVPPSRLSTLMDVPSACKHAGIQFMGSPNDHPEICICTRPTSAST
jgi:hypothetical protein